MPKKQRSDNPRKGSARPQPEKGHIQDSGPISENIAETWQPKTIEDVVERVLEHIQEGLRATGPISVKTQANFDLLKNVLLENMIRADQGLPLHEVPEMYRPPRTPLYEQSFLSAVGEAFRRAERAGGRLEAKNQLLSYVNWLGKATGAPPKPKTHDIGRKAYELLAEGKGNEIAKLCDRQHKHVRQRCYDYAFQCAKRYAAGRLPWPVSKSRKT